MQTKTKLSVVVPLYNEAQSVAPLHGRIIKALREFDSFEVLFVDDGSTDSTFAEIQKLAPIVALKLSRNFGQTAALAAGISKATGDVIVTLDGDLENDPSDIPKLITKLQEGFDVVSGWRKNRWQGQWFSRRIPSVIANSLISLATGARLHDHGCTLKAYRRDTLTHLKLYGEMHRMIAAYAKLFCQARIAEIPVGYTPRQFGKSKYGILRSFKVILDLVAIRFFVKYANRPMHFFGAIGFFSCFLGLLALAGMFYFKYALGITFIETPLPTLSGVFTIIGVQFILMGLLAELIVRNSAEAKTFIVEEEVRNT